jgi:predicted HTH domain antitoxin
MTMPPRWTRPEVPFPERYRRLALLAYENHEISLSRLATYLETSMGEANLILERAEHGEPAEAAAP